MPSMTITNAQADIIYTGFAQPGGSSTSYTVPPPSIILYTVDASNPPNITSASFSWVSGLVLVFKHSEHYALSNLLAMFPAPSTGSHYPQYFLSKVSIISA